MKLCAKILAIVVIVSMCAFVTSCAGPTNYSYQNVALTLTPYLICNSCFTGSFYYQINPAGAGGIAGSIGVPRAGSGDCIEFQANVTNAPANFTWTLYPTANATSGTPAPGTLSATTGSIVYYCSPGNVPIYTGAALAQATAMGIPQGSAEIVVSTPNPSNPSQPLTQSQAVSLLIVNPPCETTSGPCVVTGFNNIAASTSVILPLGSTYQFNGYVAGMIGLTVPSCPTGTGPAYGLTYNVNGVAGGAGTGAGQFGTISSTGLYTAPTAYPSATVKTASITVTSTACPTIVSTPVNVNFQ